MEHYTHNSINGPDSKSSASWYFFIFKFKVGVTVSTVKPGADPAKRMVWNAKSG